MESPPINSIPIIAQIMLKINLCAETEIQCCFFYVVFLFQNIYGAKSVLGWKMDNIVLIENTI